MNLILFSSADDAELFQAFSSEHVFDFASYFCSIRLEPYIVLVTSTFENQKKIPNWSMCRYVVDASNIILVIRIEVK